MEKQVSQKKENSKNYYLNLQLKRLELNKLILAHARRLPSLRTPISIVEMQMNHRVVSNLLQTRGNFSLMQFIEGKRCLVTFYDTGYCMINKTMYFYLYEGGHSILIRREGNFFPFDISNLVA